VIAQQAQRLEVGEREEVVRERRQQVVRQVQPNELLELGDLLRNVGEVLRPQVQALKLRVVELRQEVRHVRVALAARGRFVVAHGDGKRLSGEERERRREANQNVG